MKQDSFAISMKCFWECTVNLTWVQILSCHKLDVWWWVGELTDRSSLTFNSSLGKWAFTLTGRCEIKVGLDHPHSTPQCLRYTCISNFSLYLSTPSHTDFTQHSTQRDLAKNGKGVIFFQHLMCPSMIFSLPRPVSCPLLLQGHLGSLSSLNVASFGHSGLLKTRHAPTLEALNLLLFQGFCFPERCMDHSPSRFRL